jgi:hypothetical protein
LQFGVQKLEQVAPANSQVAPGNSIDQHRALSDWPPLKGHAIAMATDVNAKHPRTKRFEQNLGIGRVVAEVCNDEGIMVVLAINRRQRIGTGTVKKPLRDCRMMRIRQLAPTNQTRKQARRKTARANEKKR